MCYNEGIEDRFIRAVIGLGFLVVGVFLIASGHIVTMTPVIVAIIGAVLLGTSIVGLCPLYSILRINTGCKKA